MRIQIFILGFKGLRNSEAGIKIRPNGRILSIITQIRFFISLHLHNVYKAISSLLVLYFFLGNFENKADWELLIAFIFFLIINFLGAAFTLCILFFIIFHS